MLRVGCETNDQFAFAVNYGFKATMVIQPFIAAIMITDETKDTNPIILDRNQAASMHLLILDTFSDPIFTVVSNFQVF